MLGFLEVQPNGNEPLGFLFLPNPHVILFAHHSGSGPSLPGAPPKGLSTHIVPGSWNAFISRALELGCKDVKALMTPLVTAPVSAKKAPATNRAKSMSPAKS